MLMLRKAKDRGQTLTPWLNSYHTFSFNDYFDRHWHHFHDLRVINEDFVAPKQGFGMHPHANMEILTYVTEGVLSHQDSLGHQFQVKAGEWQRMSAGTGISHSEWNQGNDACHLFQIWVRPNVQDINPSYEQKAFPRVYNTWQTIASPTSENGALLIHQHIELLRYISSEEQTAELNLQHHPHFLQVVSGSLQIGEYSLAPSDAIAIEEESTINIRLNANSEILLFKFIKK